MIAVLLIAGCSRGYADCETPDGTMACWNATDEMFRWEDGAVIEIGVDNDTMGAALVEKWNADYPELAGKVVFRNYGIIINYYSVCMYVCMYVYFLKNKKRKEMRFTHLWIANT